MGDTLNVPKAADDRRILAMRDLVDSQLLSLDAKQLARAADLEAEWGPDGRAVVRSIAFGPEAHLGRLPGPFGRLGGRLLRGRFEHRIDISEVEEIGPTLRLRGRAEGYDVGGLDRALIRWLLRFIPGSGA